MVTLNLFQFLQKFGTSLKYVTLETTKKTRIPIGGQTILENVFIDEPITVSYCLNGFIQGDVRMFVEYNLIFNKSLYERHIKNANKIEGKVPRQRALYELLVACCNVCVSLITQKAVQYLMVHTNDKIVFEDCTLDFDSKFIPSEKQINDLFQKFLQ